METDPRLATVEEKKQKRRNPPKFFIKGGYGCEQMWKAWSTQVQANIQHAQPPNSSITTKVHLSFSSQATTRKTTDHMWQYIHTKRGYLLSQYCHVFPGTFSKNDDSREITTNGEQYRKDAFQCFFVLTSAHLTFSSNLGLGIWAFQETNNLPFLGAFFLWSFGRVFK